MSFLVGNVSAYQSASAGFLPNVNTPVNTNPIGPAGGDLEGQYPNPTIKPGVITAANIVNNTITNVQIANNTITSTQLNTTGVTPGTYTCADITVGADGRVIAASNGSTAIVWPAPGQVFIQKTGNSALFNNVEQVLQFNDTPSTIVGWTANASPFIDYVTNAIAGYYAIVGQCNFTNVGTGAEPVKLRLYMDTGSGFTAVAESVTLGVNGAPGCQVAWSGFVAFGTIVQLRTDCEGGQTYIQGGQGDGFSRTYLNIQQVWGV